MFVFLDNLSLGILVILYVQSAYGKHHSAYSCFVHGHLLIPLSLGVLLSQCILYFVLTDIDICELVHLTL